MAGCIVLVALPNVVRRASVQQSNRHDRCSGPKTRVENCSSIVHGEIEWYLARQKYDFSIFTKYRVWNYGFLKSVKRTNAYIMCRSSRGGSDFMTRIRKLFSLNIATLRNHIIIVLYNKPVTIHYYYCYSVIVCCGFY